MDTVTDTDTRTQTRTWKNVTVIAKNKDSWKR
jgi:hypothetical protein